MFLEHVWNMLGNIYKFWNMSWKPYMLWNVPNMFETYKSLTCFKYFPKHVSPSQHVWKHVILSWQCVSIHDNPSNHVLEDM
jgi:hypothetical protein